MVTWVVVSVTVLLALGVVVLLLLHDPEEEAAWPAPPVRDPEHVRRRFSYRWPGYDPAEVDAHLDEVARAWRSSVAPDADGHRSAEELEDGGGDRPGGLDG